MTRSFGLVIPVITVFASFKHVP